MYMMMNADTEKHVNLTSLGERDVYVHVTHLAYQIEAIFKQISRSFKKEIEKASSKN